MPRTTKPPKESSVKARSVKSTAPSAQDDEAAIRAVVAFNVRIARAAARMSQDDLAEGAGTTQKYISSLEREGLDISVGLLARIARHLGVSVAELLTPAPRGPQIPSERKPFTARELEHMEIRISAIVRIARHLGMSAADLLEPAPRAPGE